MRSDALYLTDIIEAADAVAEFVAGLRKETFAGNKMARSAVLQQLTIIGEAAARLSSEFRDRHPEVEWADIVAFRNIAVHAYFSVDWPTVWVTATEDAPALREKVAALLAAEFPDIRLPGKGS
ncbi:MAG: DUF86 domain-containing protein [Planctomycetota bacterium]|nr:DUF86 domain-containing protein [Planctomycetota bacterium]